MIPPTSILLKELLNFGPIVELPDDGGWLCYCPIGHHEQEGPSLRVTENWRANGIRLRCFRCNPDVDILTLVAAVQSVASRQVRLEASWGRR